jgi:hypothetical protein
MTCHDYIDALVDLARGVSDSSPMRTAAEAHARRCPRCAERLQRERELSAALRELVHGSDDAVPRGMEGRLVAEFSQYHADRVRHTQPLTHWWAAAAVFLIATAGVTWLVPARFRAAAPQPVIESSNLQDPVPDLANFIALPGAGSMPAFERGDIIRIEIPLAGLPAYGLDMVPDGTATLVPADVLIGQDGVPRAIRLASDKSF